MGRVQRLFRREPAPSQPVDRSAVGERVHGLTAQAESRAASWLRRLGRRASARPHPERAAAPKTDALLQFASESAAAGDPDATAAPRERRYGGAIVVTAGAVMLLGAAAVPVGRATVLRRPLGGWFHRAEPLASLTVQTRPAGAEVLIDGKPSGVSPMTVSVAAGAHRISARLGTTERVVPFTLSAGTQVVQYLELEPAEAGTTAGAQTRMSITTDPPGARVDIDGTTRGRSPVDVSDLAPGAHRVSVVGETGSAERTVTTSAASAMAVVFTLRPSHVEPSDGWAVVQAPFDVQLLEHGDIIGTSSAKILMTAGVHQITLRNAQLGYEENRRVVVAPGKTVSVGITPPTASLSVNARPWADVSIDGNAVGETPLANVTIGIGSHQVVFRHPQFGERRQTIVVTLKGPNRVAVDFTRTS